MTANEKEGTVLDCCVGKPCGLDDLVEYSADAIVSKTLMDKPAGTITLFAFDKGQRLSEHTTPYDAVVQVIDGQATLTIGSEKVAVSAGEIIVMPANVPHAVTAEARFKMLLIMVRS